MGIPSLCWKLFPWLEAGKVILLFLSNPTSPNAQEQLELCGCLHSFTACFSFSFVLPRHTPQELGSAMETTSVPFPLSFHLLILHISDMLQIHTLTFASWHPDRSWERVNLWEKLIHSHSKRLCVSCYQDKAALLWVQKASVLEPHCHFWASRKCSRKATVFLTLWSLQLRHYFCCCDSRGPVRIVMSGGYLDFLLLWCCQPLQVWSLKWALRYLVSVISQDNSFDGGFLFFVFLSILSFNFVFKQILTS